MLGGQFVKMFRKKAFLHYFTMEGTDEMEFMEAERRLREVIASYECLEFGGLERQGVEEGGFDYEEDGEDGELNEEIPKIVNKTSLEMGVFENSRKMQEALFA